MDDFAGLGFEEIGRCGSMFMVRGGVRRGERVGGCVWRESRREL